MNRLGVEHNHSVMEELNKDLELVRSKGSQAATIWSDPTLSLEVRRKSRKTYGECLERLDEIRESISDVRDRCGFFREEILRLRALRFSTEGRIIDSKYHHLHEDAICSQIKWLRESLAYLGG